MCTFLGLNFIKSNGVCRGGPDIILTCPRAVKRIMGDGNLFRCLSYAITGSEDQYHEVRTKICDHLITIAHFMLFHHMGSEYTSIQQYFQVAHMDCNYVWGTDVEILTFVHLTNTHVLVFHPDLDTWSTYSPRDVELSLTNDSTGRSVYIKNSGNTHFEVVSSTRRIG